MDDLKRRMGIDAGFHADWIDELARADQQLESAQLSDRLVQRTLDRLARELPEARPSWWAWLAGQLGLRRSGLAVMFGSSLCALGALTGAGLMHAQQAAAIEHTQEQLATLQRQLQATQVELAAKTVVVAPTAWNMIANYSVDYSLTDPVRFRLIAPNLKKPPEALSVGIH